MKGISHFAAGIAAASFFPEAIETAAGGNPLYMLLGGFFGLLPDTLDFKFIRYFCKYDIEVAPDPVNPDPDLIADALIKGLGDAWTLRRKVCVKFHTLRLAADRWLAYRIEIDRKKQRITVQFGDILDTGGNTVGWRNENLKAARRMPCDLVSDYGGRVDVTFLEGPTLLLCPEKTFVRSVFIHWHREWSHSLMMACFAAGFVIMLVDVTAGLIAASALLLHVIMDQAGFMGNNLFYPLSSCRVRGERLLRSGTGIWNISAVWMSALLALWNSGLRHTLEISMFPYLLRAGLIPLLVLRFILK